MAKICCLTESCRSRAKRLRVSRVASSPLVCMSPSSSAAMLLSSRESCPNSSLERSSTVTEKSPPLHLWAARASLRRRRVRPHAVTKPKSVPRRAAGSIRRTALTPTPIKSAPVRFGTRTVPTSAPATRPSSSSSGTTVIILPPVFAERRLEFSSPARAASTSGPRPATRPASNLSPSGNPGARGRRRAGSAPRR